MKQLTTLLATICVAVVLYAQEPEIWEEDSVHIPYHEMVDSIFKHVDFSYVTTGVLVDRAFQPTQIEKYNGVLTDTNQMVIQDFNALYAVMFMGATDTTNRLPEPMSEFINHFDTLSARDVIPIPVIFYQYDKFKSNTIDDSLMYFSGIQLYDNLNRTESPYEQHLLFGAAPAVNIADTNVLQLIISNDFYYSNSDKTIHTIQVDYGNETGYRTITMGNISNVTYTSGGDKTIKVKITYTDNTVMESHSFIRIDGLCTIPLGLPFDLAFSLIEGTASGCVYIQYGCGNTAITKPFIIIEGFDPPQTPNTGLQQIYNLIPTYIQMEINSAGYDLIILDFNNGADYIQNNANLVKKLIQVVNQMKAANNSTEMNVVLGASMGGLVARWALKSMENSNINHETSKFISFDSPHIGANVPLGFQKMQRHLANVGVGPFQWKLKHLVPELQIGESILNTPAARQMLVYHGYANDVQLSERLLFKAQLDVLGHPNGFIGQPLEKIAISNGSQIAFGQGFYTTEKLLGVDSQNSYYMQLFNHLFLTKLGTGAFVDLEVFALPHYTSTDYKIYQGKIYGSILFLPIVVSKITNNVKYVKPYDNAPGGIMDLTAVKTAFENADPNLSSAIYFPYPYFSFIPSVSSLDIESPYSDNLFYDISSGNIVHTNKTPFHDYAAPAGLVPSPSPYNEVHVSFTGTNINFLFGKLFYNLPSFPSGILSNSISNRTYNFGKGTQYFTPDFLRGITINANGSIHVNVNDGVSFTDLNYNWPIQGSHYDLYVKRNCDGTTAVVEINADGEFRVGDALASNTATVHFNAGTSLVLKSGSKLIVEEGSRIIIKPGSSFIWEDGAEIILAGPNSLIDIQSDNTDIILNSGNVFWLHKGTATQGGTIRINHGKFLMNSGSRLDNNHCKVVLLEDVEFTWENGADLILEDYESMLDVHYPATYIDLASGHNFYIQRGTASTGGGVSISSGNIIMNSGSTIHAEGFLAVGKNTTFVYNANSTIFCEFDQSFVQFEGELHIGDNAEFTFTGDGSFKFGLPQDWNNYTNIHAGTGSSIRFEGSGPTDIIVSVFDHTWIGNVSASFTIRNGKVQLGEHSWIGTAGDIILQDIEVVSLHNSQYYPHNGIYLNGQPNHTIERISVSGGNQGLTCRNFYGGSGVTIKESRFHSNGIGVHVFDKNVNFVNCDFSNNGIGWSAANMSWNSSALNCIVTDNDTGSFFRTTGSAQLTLDKCSYLDNYSYGANFAGSNSFIIKCGTYINWLFGLTSFNNSDLILSPLLAKGAGKVDVSSNEISNILLGFNNGFTTPIPLSTSAKSLHLEKGFNKLAPDLDCNCGLPAYQLWGRVRDCLNINNNQWEANSPGNISSYDLWGYQNCNCNRNPNSGGCPITGLTDNDPKWHLLCYDIDEDPSEERSFIEYCPECPVISSENFEEVIYNEAFLTALSTTTEFDEENGNDLLAFNMFYEITQFGFYYDMVEVKKIQSLAYNRMKNLLVTLGERDPVVFGPSSEEMARSLEIVETFITYAREYDDDILEYHSYLDQANFHYLAGNRGNAIEILLQLPNCIELDSNLTAFANERICFYYAVEEILSERQHIMRFDSLMNNECYVSLRTGIGLASAKIDTVIYSINPISSPASITDNLGNTYLATTVTDSSDNFAIVKTLANQSQAWQFTLDGWNMGTDSAKVITADAAGYIYAAGKAWNGYEFNAVTAKINSDGEPVWTAFYNFPGMDATPVGISVDSNFIVTVYTHIGDSSTSDYALIKYSQCDTSCVLRIGNNFENVDLNNPMASEEFSIYPNPANDILNIQYSTSMNNAVFQLIDMAGRIIIKEELNSKEDSKKIDISFLPSGIYSAIIVTGDKIQQVNKLAIVR
jgi:hypothetical protein